MVLQRFLLLRGPRVLPDDRHRNHSAQELDLGHLQVHGPLQAGWRGLRRNRGLQPLRQGARVSEARQEEGKRKAGFGAAGVLGQIRGVHPRERPVRRVQSLALHRQVVRNDVRLRVSPARSVLNISMGGNPR